MFRINYHQLIGEKTHLFDIKKYNKCKIDDFLIRTLALKDIVSKFLKIYKINKNHYTTK